MDGSAKFMFMHKKTLYYVPLILMLKCLIDVTDLYIYNALTTGCEDDLYYKVWSFYVNCLLSSLILF